MHTLFYYYSKNHKTIYKDTSHNVIKKPSSQQNFRQRSPSYTLTPMTPHIPLSPPIPTQCSCIITKTNFKRVHFSCSSCAQRSKSQTGPLVCKHLGNQATHIRGPRKRHRGQ